MVIKMINQETIFEIYARCSKNLGIRDTARKLNVDRNTVRKYYRIVVRNIKLLHMEKLSLEELKKYIDLVTYVDTSRKPKTLNNNDISKIRKYCIENNTIQATNLSDRINYSAMYRYLNTPIHVNKIQQYNHGVLSQSQIENLIFNLLEDKDFFKITDYLAKKEKVSLSYTDVWKIINKKTPTH